MANKSVLTQEDFLDFYNSHIKPFLGYSFTQIANKFDKANLYSNTEKIVGQWTDGKPLYQKTFHVAVDGNNVTGGAGDTDIQICELVDLASLGIEAVAELRGTYANNVVLPRVMFNTNTKVISNWCRTLYISNNKIMMQGTSLWYQGATVYYADVTLRYTKASDSATAIGSDTDYSTTEKIVGTWTDGKPVYQKVVELPSAFSFSTGNSWVDVTGVSIANGDQLIRVDCFQDKSLRNIPVLFRIGNDTLQYFNENFSANMTYYKINKLIIQYTKTTD